MIVKDKKLLDFYTTIIENELIKYEPGAPSNKPDVLKQIKEKDAQRNAQNVQSYIENLQGANSKLQNIIQEKDKKIQELSIKCNEFKAKYEANAEMLKNIQEELARDAERNQHM